MWRCRTVDKQHEPDLFRACRGGGGGNFGVVTGFLFDRLPVAPFEVANAHLSFDWPSMTEDNFTAILLAFGDYWATAWLRPGYLGTVCRDRPYARFFGPNWTFPAILQPGWPLRRPEAIGGVPRSV